VYVCACVRVCVSALARYACKKAKYLESCLLHLPSHVPIMMAGSATKKTDICDGNLDT
jgi:hypothetical protein